jgi:DNA polymerase-3 subunit delta
MAKSAGRTFEDIVKEIKQGKFAPVYFLEGEEPFFIDEISNLIEATAVPEDAREFNQSILYGKETDIQKVLSEARRFPVFADRQLIVVREAQEMKNLDKKVSIKLSGKEQDVNYLEQYLERPVESTVLVFCYKYKAVDKRTGLAKALQSKAVYFQSSKLYPDKLPAWISSLAALKKIRMQPQAAQLMAEHLGNDLSRISNELDKLLISTGEGKEISTEDVMTNIGISKEFNVFELQQALTEKNVLKAHRIADYFANNQRDNPIFMVLGSLGSFFTRILVFHSMQGKSDSEMAQAIGISPYFLKDYRRAAQIYPRHTAEDIIGYLRDTDMKAKGSAGITFEHGDLYKELIFRIMH